jgi:hypothetical protein
LDALLFSVKDLILAQYLGHKAYSSTSSPLQTVFSDVVSSDKPCNSFQSDTWEFKAFKARTGYIPQQ